MTLDVAAPATLTVTINGVARSLAASEERSLLEVLREDLRLTGAKPGCGEGVCGACTVLIDGQPRRSCLTLARDAAGTAVTTIEGFSAEGPLQPVQVAMVTEGAVQCGYCTPGMVLGAVSLLSRNPDPGSAEIREAMAGNLCRCCGYLRIERAIRRAVLQAAAERARWREGRALAGSGTGIGIACGIEKGGRIATCVHVRLGGACQVEILKVVTAYECGTIVNPDNLARQIESATVMGLGGALFEAVHFDSGRILNASLHEYRVPRFTDVPPVEVVLLDRPDIPSAGGGETPIVAVAPALANALVAAGLPRSRSLPLLP